MWWYCTEICYFNQVKSVFKKQNLKVLWNLWQISWIDFDKIANKKESIFNKIKDKINFTERDIKSTKSIICYLLDVDWNNRDSYIQDNINFIKNNFENENIKVFFSNKDFELWILLHFEEYKKEDWKYIERIEKETGKKYDKWSCNCNIDFFKKIIEKRLERAIENWKNLEDYQKERNLNLKDKNPYTEVYKIFKELEIIEN